MSKIDTLSALNCWNILLSISIFPFKFLPAYVDVDCIIIGKMKSIRMPSCSAVDITVKIDLELCCLFWAQI